MKTLADEPTELRIALANEIMHSAIEKVESLGLVARFNTNVLRKETVSCGQQRRLSKKSGRWSGDCESTDNPLEGLIVE